MSIIASIETEFGPADLVLAHYANGRAIAVLLEIPTGRSPPCR
jgi:hypothetical protein